MVIKLNQKPIVVREDNEDQKDFSPVYFAVSCIGYALILWIMDYSCFMFFGLHPFPFLNWLFKIIGGVFHGIG
jgi:hypothetical protein